jgi:hypothetical protein
MGNSFRDTKHTRHILRRFHYVREEVDSGRFRLFWIKTDDELADIGTKQTPGPRHTLLTNTILVRVSDGLKSIKLHSLSLLSTRGVIAFRVFRNSINVTRDVL